MTWRAPSVGAVEQLRATHRLPWGFAARLPGSRFRCRPIMLEVKLLGPAPASWETEASTAFVWVEVVAGGGRSYEPGRRLRVSRSSLKDP